ncbi:RNA polymerase sigma factor [Pseudoteredinibacter isoporae]|uniref:RNA polymerase sigma-70 factor (ECF subfamily) n=1 Tax=Pseudoteredinibacter isoporae TaxID=570281 RepID=A0A7X0JUL4_9GAMM|nr:sigma-70 family RNA polymerase sigma factor [Pseudoteredinibacter isoporae]MBB6522567.1 RNA polymerase sigma-70 factor (ECF subfamily) [Pseudoteredinibacter isoporae]NHO88097.1 sigma-70 family RNA polymerase sigma factor [Pseudoteredinibacter isoporae]NIB23572.1 sigma-70 family RNA polymerase sigma factor [Pseudoteredinibacter isoporae]
MSLNDRYTEIYLSIREQLLRVVSRIAPPKDIEDIVQETYVRLCQVKCKDDIQAPQSFMFKTAKNLALDHIKRAESRLALSMEEEEVFQQLQNSQHSQTDRTYEQAASEEEFALFCEATRRLPVQCRKAFILKKVYGHSQKEIAKELGLSESTVEKHIALGIQRCAQFMDIKTGQQRRVDRKSTQIQGKGGQL